MKIVNCHTEQEWVEFILSEIKETHDMCSKSFKMLFPGGSTPVPILKAISQVELDEEKTQIGLVDDRMVESDSEFSNFGLLLKHFGENWKQSIQPLVSFPDDPIKNLLEATDLYESTFPSIDLTFLGMGTDGHFASIFPNDEDSQKAIKGFETVYLTKAPNHPNERITLSLSKIISSRKLVLLIRGKEKMDVINDSQKNMPIHQLIKTREDITLVYCDL